MFILFTLYAVQKNAFQQRSKSNRHPENSPENQFRSCYKIRRKKQRVLTVKTQKPGLFFSSLNVALCTMMSSKRSEEAMRWSIVHRHIEVKVQVTWVVVYWGEVGQRGHIGGWNGLKENTLRPGQHDLGDEQWGAHGLRCCIRGLRCNPRTLRWDGLRGRSHSLPCAFWGRHYKISLETTGV